MSIGIGEGVGIVPGMGAWERVSVGAVIGWPVGVVCRVAAGHCLRISRVDCVPWMHAGTRARSVD